MYRSALISIALAAWACNGSGTKSASAANSNTTGSTTQASSTVRTSDTTGAVTGPISTTDRSVSGYGGKGEEGSGKREAATAASPNRIPNEMGRIMVLEYHLITDHNGLYARERGQFRKDLELLYSRGYRPVNIADG